MALANSWGGHLKALPANGDADRELQSLRTLLDGSAADSMRAMQDEKDTVLLTACPVTKQPLLMHHFHVYGGTHLNRDVFYSVLIGTGPRASSALVDPDSMFQTVTFAFPFMDDSQGNQQCR